jgi:integrase
MKGHVEKRKGRWYVVLELAPHPTTGKRRRSGSSTRTGYRTRAEALEELDRARERGRRGWTGPERITLAGWLLDEWLPGVELEREPTTAALYRTLLGAYVIPRIGGEKLQNVTAAMLTRLYGELRAGGGRGGRPLSPKTVRNVHTTLRKALADAAAARRLDWNPAASAKVPKIDRNPEPNAWTPEEAGRFLAHVAGDRLEALYILAVVTGFRRGELLALRRSDLELDAAGGRIAVRRSRVQYGRLHLEKDPKTPRSRRTVAVDGSVATMLRRHLASQASERLAAGAAYADDGLVFADEIGRPL